MASHLSTTDHIELLPQRALHRTDRARRASGEPYAHTCAVRWPQLRGGHRPQDEPRAALGGRGDHTHREARGDHGGGLRPFGADVPEVRGEAGPFAGRPQAQAQAVAPVAGRHPVLAGQVRRRHRGPAGRWPAPSPISTRGAALMCSGSMAYAYFTVHQRHGLLPIQNGGEAAVMFCWAFLALAVVGPGALALDGVLRRRFRAGTSPARREPVRATGSRLRA